MVLFLSSRMLQTSLQIGDSILFIISFLVHHIEVIKTFIM